MITGTSVTFYLPTGQLKMFMSIDSALAVVVLECIAADRTDEVQVSAVPYGLTILL